jgi:glycine/D-amino acid oxidase-like deaminating enzyme
VLEREVAGFGASGRNGGWCSALFPASLPWLARRYGRDAAVAQYRAMQATIDEVGAVAAREGIDCSWSKGGTVTLARTPVQLERAREQVRSARAWGFGEGDLVLLGAAEARERMGATRVLGATYTPHCAAIHPARLVRGLARAVEGHGVTVHENTAVTRIGPGVATTEHGTVRAEVVVRATEGYTARLPGLRRELAPVWSLMIATEPLPAEVWHRIGLRERETFTDHRHLVIYGQRTADGRLAFGGRGAPYHFASRVRPEHDREPATFDALRRVLVELLPDVREAAVTHTWGGPLGIPRDWCASVALDRRTGLARAGGYVGDGVATTNLAGRTLADLVLGRASELTALPWVGHQSPRWEPEPLRWLGVSAALRAMTTADAVEARTGRPARRAARVNRLLGH